MGIHIGDIAPDFIVDTPHGRIRFHDWIGNDWVLFFSHFGGLTPVCTTGTGRIARLAEECARRHVKLLGLSADGTAGRVTWIDDGNDIRNTAIRVPIVADPDGTVARRYDVVHAFRNETAALRSVFVIDPKKTIRLILTHGMRAEPNFDEILRVIDALQAGEADIIIPMSISDSKTMTMFPQAWTEVRSCLHTTRP
ncbi:MAG: redoxin domain-containing protein [Paracoccus sp. (in: a-proteobacteria)]|nr:redoxin domain-containing protein [Paracoccus sp. (in: a-proteobacteria)]